MLVAYCSANLVCVFTLKCNPLGKTCDVYQESKDHILQMIPKRCFAIQN